jgi:integrase
MMAMSLRLSEAVDLYVGDLERRGLSSRTVDSYRRKLDVLCALNERRDVTEVTSDDCRRALDSWLGKSSGTMAHSVTVYATFFRWLYQDGRIEADPMLRIPRPRQVSPEDLDVPSVSGADVVRLLDACETTGELLCIALLAYLGPRRAALARLRWRDVDFEKGTVRFFEKARKSIAKPMPRELQALLEGAARERSTVEGWRDEHVIPMGLAQRRSGERDDRVIWRLYKQVAKRAGVGGHVHAVRAAFAVRYLESRPGDLEALQALLGHRSVRTTQVYLRKLDRERVMERVRDLSWQEEQFADSLAMGAGGFEPP